MVRHEQIRFKMLRYGVEYGEIFADDAPNMRMSGSGEIKRSLQGTFLPYALDVRGREMEINWLVDEIKPYLVLDGVEYPLGVFMPATISPKKEKGKTTLSVEAYDQCWRVRDYKVESRVAFDQNAKYIGCIESLLAACGIAAISAVDTDSTLATARDDWETGTSYLSIVNELLKEINYKDLWFDENGTAILEPASIPTARNIKHRFTDQKPDPRNEKEIGMINVHPVMTKTTDIYQKPNVIICICSSPDRTSALRATAENMNPESPLSIQRRGRRIVQVVKVNNIPDQNALDAYAERLLMESMVTGEELSFQTPLQPGFGVDDVCAVKYEDLSGVCVEREWSMELRPGGTMSHRVERVVVNIG